MTDEKRQELVSLGRTDSATEVNGWLEQFGEVVMDIVTTQTRNTIAQNPDIFTERSVSAFAEQVSAEACQKLLDALEVDIAKNVAEKHLRKFERSSLHRKAGELISRARKELNRAHELRKEAGYTSDEEWSVSGEMGIAMTELVVASDYLEEAIEEKHHILHESEDDSKTANSIFDNVDRCCEKCISLSQNLIRLIGKKHHVY